MYRFLVCVALVFGVGCGGDSGTAPDPLTPEDFLFSPSIFAFQDGPSRDGVGEIVAIVDPLFHDSCGDNPCVYVVRVTGGNGLSATLSESTVRGVAKFELPVSEVPYSLVAVHEPTGSSSLDRSVTVR